MKTVHGGTRTKRLKKTRETPRKVNDENLQTNITEYHELKRRAEDRQRRQPSTSRLNDR